MALTVEFWAQCRFPPLAEPYAGALRDAVTFILENFDVHGILVCGSIVRGNPHPGSDFDIMVLHAKDERQRLQRFFRGVPAEIFVNPPQSIRGYFVEERAAARPLTAHMWTTGVVVLDRHPLIAQLRQEAAVWLALRPDLSAVALTMKRYFSADELENALDVAKDDPAMATLLMHHALFRMIEYRFLATNQNIPRHKELLAGLKTLDAAAGAAVEQFLLEPDLPRKFALGKAAAQHLTGATGFFEWQTPPETIAPNP